VVLQVPQQLEHRLVAAREVGTAELWVVRRPEERVDLLGVGLDRQPSEGPCHRFHEQGHVRVIAAVVLDHRCAEPAEVALVGRLPGLLVAQRRVGLGHLREPPEDEVELDRHRLLAPQRAVVVEGGDPLLGREVVRAVTGHPGDELSDRPAGRRVVPGRQRFVGLHCLQSRAMAPARWRSTST
jgi:hypothetical protein